MFTSNLFNSSSMGLRHPFAEMNRLARQIDGMTHAMSRRPGARMVMPKVFPAINITEDKEKYYVRAELPGMKTDEVKLEVTGRNLSISGDRKISSEGEKARYHRREREAGRFSRVFSLPKDVEVDSVEAKLNNGLLTIAITKSATAKAKQVEINVN